MGHDDIERRGLRRARLDHALEFRAAIIGRRGTGFHEGFDKLLAACGAKGFALPLLIGDRHVVLGLAGGRDTQVKGGTGARGTAIDVFRHLRGDLARQIGADASDERGGNDRPGLKDVGRCGLTGLAELRAASEFRTQRISLCHRTRRRGGIVLPISGTVHLDRGGGDRQRDEDDGTDARESLRQAGCCRLARAIVGC